MQKRIGLSEIILVLTHGHLVLEDHPEVGFPEVHGYVLQLGGLPDEGFFVGYERLIVRFKVSSLLVTEEMNFGLTSCRELPSRFLVFVHG